MTKQQFDRLLVLADRIGVNLLEQQDGFIPSEAADDFGVTPPVEPTLALAVGHLRDVVALNAAYNEEFDNHKFWYSLRYNKYFLY